MERRQIGLRGLRLVMKWNIGYQDYDFLVHGEVLPDADPETDIGLFNVWLLLPGENGDMSDAGLEYLGCGDTLLATEGLIANWHYEQTCATAMGDEDTDNGCAPDEPSDDFPMWLEYDDDGQQTYRYDEEPGAGEP